MPNLPIRGLGKVGVITDALPHDLPESAWSNARNVRFDNESVVRSSVFKPFILQQDFTTADPILVVDDSLRSANKSVTTLKSDGTITRVTEGFIHDVTPTETMAVITRNATACIAGSVSYINTPNNPPLSYANGETKYSIIPHWDADDRCESLRKYRDFLIALNVTKTTTEYPNMVKWSDAIMAGTRPKWDVTLENGLAGENVLNDSTGYIVDGLELGGSFMIYGSREAWRMDYIGGDFVFSFQKVFNDFSIMTQNCVVEVANRHFVFCEDDIVMTDGITRESICEGKVRRKIFTSLDYANRTQCRVILNSAKSEILFCYPSLGSDAQWSPNHVGCNEAAVFNYVNGTWTFIDLPNVTSGVEATHPVGSTEDAKTWAGLVTWDQLKFNWTFTTASPATLILASAAGEVKTGNVYFYDDDAEGWVANEADPDTYWPAWAEIRMADFDALGLPLSSTKLLRQIVPQVTTNDDTQSVYFTFAADMSNVTESAWKPPVRFNPYEQYKLDCRLIGRYLSLRYEIPAGAAATLSGFDLDIVKIAGR